MVPKVDRALAFAQQVIDSGALYFRRNPAVGERLKEVAGQNRNYLAHEYFNEDWRVTTFSNVAKCLDDAKLSFVASAHLLDHVEVVNLTAEGNKLLAGIKHPILRQSVRDYFVSQTFRRDVFIKGPRRLSGLEQHDIMRSQAFALTTHADDVPMKVSGAVAEAKLHEQVYRPLIEVLAENDYVPKKVDELAAHAKLKAMPIAQVMQAIFILAGAGHVHPAQETASASRTYCCALNRYLCERARRVGDIQFLASPVIGELYPSLASTRCNCLAKVRGECRASAIRVLMSQGSARRQNRPTRGGGDHFWIF